MMELGCLYSLAEKEVVSIPFQRTLRVTGSALYVVVVEVKPLVIEQEKSLQLLIPYLIKPRMADEHTSGVNSSEKVELTETQIMVKE
ncbi:hypothetical protein E3N88_43825 [Mikania micrantha]|uniref:Uncharacterized protein n=1 Tax=Mikania micrantha TaxID=192012 RepID=A0A5N6LDU0_9ASTR|nr:hypothetical protein E3N88_43825 [Mikania micrantha]